MIEEVKKGDTLLSGQTDLLMMYKDRIPGDFQTDPVLICKIDCLWSAFSDLVKEWQCVNSKNE